MPAAIAAAGRLGRQRLPVDAHRPAVVGVDAEDRPGDLAAPGADEAGQADDLAGAHGEGESGRPRPW